MCRRGRRVRSRAIDRSRGRVLVNVFRAKLRASGQRPDPGKWPLGFFPDDNPWFPDAPRESLKGSAAAFMLPLLIALICAAPFVLWILNVHEALAAVRGLELGEGFVGAVVIAVLAAPLIAMTCALIAFLRAIDLVRYRGWRVGRILPARVVSEHWATRNILSWAVALFAVITSHGHASFSSVLSHHKSVSVEFMDGGCRRLVRMFSHGTQFSPGQFLWICEPGRPWPKSMVHLFAEGDWRKTPIPDEVCAWLAASLSAAKKESLTQGNPYSRKTGKY
jgi:hypothetical protein